ncbi:MAG: hypothetical protein Q8N42_02055 [bacterium]|nr:hypothetical protein [bacterium]
MPRSKPWLKMWVESLDDPKMLRLTMAEEAAWWRLLRLAQRCNAGGSLITSSGSPLTVQEIITCLHIASPDEIAAFGSMIKKMEMEGSLLWNNTALHIIHFSERQEMAASETPEAVRERVRLFRQRHVTETPLQPELPQVSSPLQPPITNIERKIERESVTAENSLHQAQGNEKAVTKEQKLYGVGNNVHLTDPEYQKLIAEFGEAGTLDRINNLSTYIGSKGKKYKSHYLTILHWESMDKGKQNSSAEKKGKYPGKPRPGTIATSKELDEWEK